MTRVAVIGASGFVGTALTQELLENGHEVVALVRTPSRWPLQHKNLEVVQGTLEDAEAVFKVLKEAKAAYYLAHGLQESSKDFEYLEATAATQFVRVATRAKMRHVIYLGGLGAEDLTPHLRSRQLVGEILGLLPGSSLEFRASIVLGEHSQSFEMLKALSGRLPVCPEAAWMDSLCQPIAKSDLLKYLVAGLDVTFTGHKVVEIGGPERLSYRELLALTMDLQGLSKPRLALPPGQLSLYYPLLDVLLPEFPSISRKLFESLAKATVVTNNSAFEMFPDIHPITVREALTQALEKSNTIYPKMWQGDFWKEVMEITLEGKPEQWLQKMMSLAGPYQAKVVKRLKGKSHA